MAGEQVVGLHRYALGKSCRRCYIADETPVNGAVLIAMTTFDHLQKGVEHYLLHRGAASIMRVTVRGVASDLEGILGSRRLDRAHLPT